MQGKNFLASKTVWFNLLTGGLGAAQALGGAHLVPQDALIFISALGNFALRWVTTQPITVG